MLGETGTLVTLVPPISVIDGVQVTDEADDIDKA